MNPLWSLQHLATSRLQFTTFENSVFDQKRTLVKLLGQKSVTIFKKISERYHHYSVKRAKSIKSAL